MVNIRRIRYGYDRYSMEIPINGIAMKVSIPMNGRNICLTMKNMRTIEQVHHRSHVDRTFGNDQISGVNVRISGDVIHLHREHGDISCQI